MSPEQNRVQQRLPRFLCLISIAQQSNLLELFWIFARFLLYWCEPGFSPQYTMGFVRFLVNAGL